MHIIIQDGERILVKHDQTEVRVNDGDVIQYTGIYYKQINDIVRTVQIDTTFVGVVECERSNSYDGITGIYIRPLYIWDMVMSGWRKIVNLHQPTQKYFFYPHLLSLPKHNYHVYPIYCLETCENKSLDEFVHIQVPFDLGDPCLL